MFFSQELRVFFKNCVFSSKRCVHWVVISANSEKSKLFSVSYKLFSVGIKSNFCGRNFQLFLFKRHLVTAISIVSLVLFKSFPYNPRIIQTNDEFLLKLHHAIHHIEKTFINLQLTNSQLANLVKWL